MCVMQHYADHSTFRMPFAGLNQWVVGWYTYWHWKAHRARQTAVLTFPREVDSLVLTVLLRVVSVSITYKGHCLVWMRGIVEIVQEGARHELE